MGVPKFFRFISERYPCLSDVVKEYEMPEFDNFYIDANGIIHNCSHPDDSIDFRISEEDIFKDIFYYLEMLFMIIKPKKLFFIAIDGVAPRAKMNQQRGRRFRTAKDAEKAKDEALKKGEVLPESERFDSNCITPGTVFMEKLHRQLQYFIKHKISTDIMWQRPTVIFSGHNVPGEGEHKIMDYIRYLRSQSDWDPNTRHCLHGLDADLIMLGLCTHEPHFSLLREEVKFTRSSQKKKLNADETKFYLLRLSMMRDYLELEFQDLKNKLPFPFDMERIIDDWVLMGFLVGNDFIPNLPHFHLANNALHLLCKAYIEVLPTLDGYINDSGVLNLERFEKYLRRLALFDFDNFKDVHTDLKYLESKTGKSLAGQLKGSELDELDSEVLALVKATDTMLGLDADSDNDSEDDEMLHEEFIRHKIDFYKNKLEYEQVDSETLREQAEGYIRAIQWNLYYYYTGCPSWSWYYPHHYSPYVSDINGFSGLDVKFEPSTPFLPFQQLLAVLPAASKSIVPPPFRDLMTSPESPIIDYYPPDFDTDLNGKKQEWEAVVLIPFIDEKSLLSAMQPYYKYLTEEENMRNSVKPMEMYTYSSESLGLCEAPEYFTPIQDNHAQLKLISTADIAIKPSMLAKGRLPGAIPGAYLGFPDLSGIPFTASLKPTQVKVFEHPSKGDNMILSVDYRKIDKESEIQTIAGDLLDKIVFVRWPHIQRGKVTSILTEKYLFKMESGKVIKIENIKNVQYNLVSTELFRTYEKTLGIDLTKVDLVVYVRTVEGKRYIYEGKKGKLTYLWSEKSVPFPYQTILQTAAILEKDDVILQKEKKLDEIFPVGLEVLLLSQENYGSFGKVSSVTDNSDVVVNMDVKADLDLTGILVLSSQTELRYYPGSVAAQRLGIGSFLFSRVTGSVFIQNIENDHKLNVGLGLKFTKVQEELVGFTKKEGNLWLYSEKTIALLDDYMAKFPELFQYLEKNTENYIFFNKDVFPEKTDEKVQEIKKWLKAQPHNNAQRRPFGAKLISNDAMKEIEIRIIEAGLHSDKTLEKQLVSIQPSEIFIPSVYCGKAPPDPSVEVHLLDRVINVLQTHCIPLGSCGTIIGYDKPNQSADTLYDILFDKPIIGGRCLGCDESRVYRLPCHAFINISYGKRIREPVKSNNTKMDKFSHVKEDWRSEMRNNSSRSDNRTSLPSPGNDSIQNIGNNKVKQFFDGYINSGKLVPSSHVTRMPFFPNNQIPNEHKQPGADSEFQAIWNVLQNQKAPEEKSLRPQVPVAKEPVSSPVETSVNIEQTNALRKLLKLSDSPSSVGNEQLSSGELRPQVPLNQSPNAQMRTPPNNSNNFPPTQGLHQTKSCGHCGCCSALVQLCASKSIPYPSYNYTKIPSSGEITCTVNFKSDYNYGTHVGDSCRSKEEAAENAACKAIRHILQRDDGNVRRPPMSVPPVTMVYRLPQVGARQPTPTVRVGMGQLPTPPMTWCPSRKPVRCDNTNRRSPRGPTPPNQIQPFQRYIPTVSSLEGSSRPAYNERVPSASNKNEGGRRERKNWEGTTSGSSPKPIPHQPRRPFVPRSKPRIAANFSVPLVKNDQTP